MQPVVLYTTKMCPFCTAAKRLLDKKGVAYKNIDVMNNPKLREEMMQRASGRHTVPQIFIGSVHVGGFDDMQLLESRGKLDQLLTAG